LSNGDFSSRTSGWECEQPGGFADCSVGGGAYVININDGGTATWHIQPQQKNVSLSSGVEYTFAFDAKAQANRTAEIKIERDDTPWEDFTNTGAGQNLTTTMQRFVYTFTMPTSLSNARVVMNTGANNSGITVDNVWLVEGGSDPCNGIVGCDIGEPYDDNDGVPNAQDLCPNTPPNTNVDANGCTIPDNDEDDDGVLNGDDLCPGTPLGTPVDVNGCPVVSNLLNNGNFENGSDGWVCEQPVGSANCSVVNGAYQIAITNGGSENWNVQPQYKNVTLSNGKTYTFAFDAKSASSRTAEIKVERSVSPWEDFSAVGSGQNLTTTMQRFSYTFTMPTSLADARVVMNIGGSNSDVTIDNVWLVEGNSDPCSGQVGCSTGGADDDQDGVDNSVDQCPNTQAGDSVDSVGCSTQDDDNDGVTNDADQCPNTPPGDDVNSVGCSVGNPVTVRLEVENYLRFMDTTPGNQGGACRNDDVDIENTTDIGGGCNVGWTAAGEWLEFDANVVPGTYDVIARVASEAGGSLSVSADGFVSGTFDNTGGWQKWENLNLGQVTINSASVTVRITFESDSTNLNWIELAPPCIGLPQCSDTDGDGVMDDVDLCPNTSPGTPVGADGCAITSGITAAQAVADMGKGFNIGQTFESTDQPRNFATVKTKIDAYYAEGFRNVRIPITWRENIGGDMLANPDTGVVNRGHQRLQTIKEVVDYALSLPDMYVVINMHHETSVKNQNLWWVVEQVWADAADIFKDRSNRLIFEILNEPHKDEGGMAAADVRNLSIKAYAKIREVSPQRLVVIGGNEWFHATELAATWPSLEGVGNGQDPYLFATFHHYDPWDDFHFEDTWPKTFNFDDGNVGDPMEIARSWAASVGGMPIYIGEWGVGWGKHRNAMTCNNIRLWYQKFGPISSEKGISTSVWDDSGWFKVFDNSTGSFNNNLATCVSGECEWENDFTRMNAGCL